jgi:hypothetical protein
MISLLTDYFSHSISACRSCVLPEDESILKKLLHDVCLQVVNDEGVRVDQLTSALKEVAVSYLF